MIIIKNRIGTIVKQSKIYNKLIVSVLDILYL